MAVTALQSPSPLLNAALVVAAIAGLGLLLGERERLRRLLLRSIDPRPLALFRVAFGLCLLLGALEVAPLRHYLFSDEGLVPSPAVSQLYGRAATVGMGDGVRSPEGFADGWAVAYYVASGRWSPLFHADSPAAVDLVYGLFIAACVGVILGWRARLSTIAAWLLFAGLLRRGDAHWGGEQVYAAFLFPLMLSRAGAAYSVDNWLRCRRLARRGLLSLTQETGGGVGAPPSAGHPAGLAAIYRRVPAWPQALMIVQLVICYSANGWAKHGPAWIRGDALADALRLDRFTRLDWGPLIAALGPWPLRIAAWAVLWWERLFPLVLVALWLRACARLDLRVQRSPLRAGLWLALAAAVGVWAAHPAAMRAGTGDAAGDDRALVAGLAALVIVAYVAARGRPLRLRLGARELRIDRAWCLRWPLSLRLWLGFGLLFHALNALLFNVGAFALATLAAYLVLLPPGPLVAGVQGLTRALARRGLPIPAHLRGDAPVPAERGDLPDLPRDSAALSTSSLAAAAALIASGGLAAAAPEGAPALGRWHAAWLIAAATLLTLQHRRARRPAPPSDVTWSYGPIGRVAAAGVTAYHLVALLLWQLPRWPSLPRRDAARALVAPWIELSHTPQVWAMFAPAPPRHSRDLRATIRDAAGVDHDLGTELHRTDNLRYPYLRQDRWRKVHENVVGARPGFARWHARYLCRRWALLHDGEPATSVTLERLTAPLTPPAAGDPIAYFRGHAEAEPLAAIACATEPFGQPDDELRARHGLPPAPPRTLHFAWPKRMPADWAERRRDLDPWAPLWPLLALALAGAAVAASRRRVTELDREP